MPSALGVWCPVGLPGGPAVGHHITRRRRWNFHREHSVIPASEEPGQHGQGRVGVQQGISTVAISQDDIGSSRVTQNWRPFLFSECWDILLSSSEGPSVTVLENGSFKVKGNTSKGTRQLPKCGAVQMLHV